MTAGSGRFRLKDRPSRGQRLLHVLTCLVILSLTFLLGVLVGRAGTRGGGLGAPEAWVRARSHSRQTDWEKGKHAAVANRGGLEDREVGRQSQIREKLTFYHTLTAPLASESSRPAPKPRDAKTGLTQGDSGQGDSAKSEVQASAGAPESRAPAAGPIWTVQVAAFRSPEPAEALQRALAASGYEAYVTPSTGEDGMVRYRVRVGGYPSRSEAEKVVERLRVGSRARGATVPGTQERASMRVPGVLTPLVVPR